MPFRGTMSSRVADDPALGASASVLEAEVALADEDFAAVRRLCREVLSSQEAAPEVRCHASELLGRIDRKFDRNQSKKMFEQELELAETHDLPLWRIRAMRELATIEMLDHAGRARLIAAREAAGDLGEVSTAAQLELQLAVVAHCRFELDLASEHARSALALAESVSLDIVRTKALLLLGENAAWRGDPVEMDRHLGVVAALEADDLSIAPFSLGARGMYMLLRGKRAEAAELLGRAATLIAELPLVEPALFRAMWPLLLASQGDRRALEALRVARRRGVGASWLNCGLLAFGEAIVMGYSGDRATARRTVIKADPWFVNCTIWADVASWLAAESAAATGWDDPGWWVLDAEERLAHHGLPAPAVRCGQLAGGARRWTGLGINAREGEVLTNVVEGRGDREIAGRLGVPTRAVEKHVEALLRKLGGNSREHLATVAEAKVRDGLSLHRVP